MNVLFQANISRLKLPSPAFALQTPAQLLLLMTELAGQTEDMEYLNLPHGCFQVLNEGGARKL